MTTILKKEWTIGSSFILFMFLLILLFNLGNLSVSSLPFMSIILLLNSLFQTDERSKMNVYLASLPIERKLIVRGRYILFFLFSLTLVAFGFLFNRILSTQHFSLTESIVLFMTMLALLSLLLPIFYSFTFNVAAIISGSSVILFGIVLFVVLFSNEGFVADSLTESILLEKSIPFALGLVILLFGLSYKISVAIFEKKELHA